MWNFWSNISIGKDIKAACFWYANMMKHKRNWLHLESFRMQIYLFAYEDISRKNWLKWKDFCVGSTSSLDWVPVWIKWSLGVNSSIPFFVCPDYWKWLYIVKSCLLFLAPEFPIIRNSILKLWAKVKTSGLKLFTRYFVTPMRKVILLQ